MSKTFLSIDDILTRVAPLVNPRTGILGTATELPRTPGNPTIPVYSTNIHCAELAMAEPPAGTGVFLEREWAKAKSYCEALERYCNVKHAHQNFIVATRQELGVEAVDMELFPRCSDAEYRNPANPTTPPSNRQPMRWVEGYSLISGQPMYVPAIGVYVGMQPEYAGETFTTSISTGTALAASYEQAIVTGIGEAIERDALSIAWWQKLALPQVDLREFPDPAFQERLRRVEAAQIQSYFFDATTDLGVATIYAVQVAPHGRLRTMVMSATRTNPLALPSKVLDESAASRIGIEHSLSQALPFDPADYRTFMRLSDGAAYYADAATAPAFDFLFEQTRWRTLDQLPRLDHPDPAVEAQRLIDIFRRAGLELIVVDLTLPALREVGLYTIKVVAPQLMPFSCNYNARFLATPRLYSVPEHMGYPVLAEAELNQWPQPFA